MSLDDSVLSKSAEELSQGKNISRCPLPPELFNYVRDFTAEYIGLKNPEKSAQFFDNQLTNILSDIVHARFGGETAREVLSETLDSSLLMAKFLVVAFFRYSNKTTGKPENIGLLTHYDTPKGNQVDLYLKEFFGIS